MAWGRAYFAAQAIAGAIWWLAVSTSPFVRDTTLGSLNPVLIATVDIPLFVGASALAAFGLRPAAVVSTGSTIVVTAALAAYATASTEAGIGVLLMAAAAFGSLVALCLVQFGRVPTEWTLIGPFAPRPASPTAPSSAHMAATAAQIIVFWGLFLGIFPIVLAFLEKRWQLTLPFPPLILPIGIVVLVLASVLGLWSAGAMSRKGGGTPLPSAMPNHLVIVGPYRYVRNPMAIAGIVQGAAVGLILTSWVVVAYAIAGSVLWNFVVRPLEEADLEARFGDQFRRYRSAVRCWCPRLTGFTDGPGVAATDTAAATPGHR